jgi:hypothetical protein
MKRSRLEVKKTSDQFQLQNGCLLPDTVPKNDHLNTVRSGIRMLAVFCLVFRSWCQLDIQMQIFQGI